MKVKLLSRFKNSKVARKVPVTVISLETGKSWVEYEDPTKAKKDKTSGQIIHNLSRIIEHLFSVLWKSIKLFVWLIGKLIPIALRILLAMASILVLSLAFLLPRW